MRIRQIIASGVSNYEAKSQRIDAGILSGKYELVENGADLAHVYGSPPRLTIPFVASEEPGRARFWIRKPRFIVTPLPDTAHQHLPEAVEEGWWAQDPGLRAPEPGAPSPEPGQHIIASYVGARRHVANEIDQALARIHRFRDDVVWKRFDSPPTPADLREVEVWVDPAVHERDFDGFTAEAIVAGKPVVASRTPINVHRLEKGRTGFLVPPHDPNELVHAILAALFKPEVARVKIESARQTAGKFRPRQRLRVLERLYESTVT